MKAFSVRKENLSQVGASVLHCVFQILTSVPSQRRYAPRSTGSVSTLKEAIRASAQVATRSKMASVSKPHSQVRNDVGLNIVYISNSLILFYFFKIKCVLHTCVILHWNYYIIFIIIYSYFNFFNQKKRKSQNHLRQPQLHTGSSDLKTLPDGIESERTLGTSAHSKPLISKLSTTCT